MYAKNEILQNIPVKYRDDTWEEYCLFLRMGFTWDELVISWNADRQACEVLPKKVLE